MTIDRKKKYNGIMKVDELNFRTKSGKIRKKEIMVRKNSVAALVYDSSLDKFVFVSQWRPGSMSDLLEIVAGTMDKEGENSDDTIQREVEEEIGYKIDSMEFIGEFYVSPGSSTEIIYLYYCVVSEKISSGGGVASEGEEIDIVVMDFSEMISTKFIDAKTIISVNWARLNHKNVSSNRS